MKKIITLILLAALVAPNFVLANENLFYYFENVYGYDSFKKNLRDIDLLAPQVYEVDYDLSIKKPSKNAEKILKYADRKKADVMPLIVNAGFSKPLMSQILADEEAQDDIIKFMIKEADKKDYVGWQFDFENIDHNDRQRYVEFVEKANKALKKKNLRFSVAVIVRATDYNPLSTNQDWSSGYDYEQLAEHSDFLSLMTYDDPNSIGPVASVPYVTKVLDYLTKKVPAEKMSLGIPFYCWQWANGERIGSTTYNLAEKTYNKKGNKKVARGFNEDLGAEYMMFIQHNQLNMMWCDNAESVEVKEGIIADYGLRGFSAWALGQEDKAIWSYLK